MDYESHDPNNYNWLVQLQRIATESQKKFIAKIKYFKNAEKNT